ncbi:hypothetical protein BGX34_004591 [Mortierella sp. NVP85]|nr:hypothetical protein BGX34_004591 [Mortierella sp. NVP85]
MRPTCAYSSPADSNLYQPFATYTPSYAYVEDEFIFVVGGLKNQMNTNQQTFLINLTRSWTTPNPDYLALPELSNIQSQTQGGAAAISADRTKAYVQYDSSMHVFNFATKSWETQTINNAALNSGKVLSAVTDPTTGTIYIPAGYANSATASSLLKFTPTANSFESIASAVLPAQLADSSTAFSAVSKSLYVFGGAAKGATTGSSNLYRYDTDGTSGWSTVQVNGTPPSPRRNACFVSAFRGAKLVLFGGYAIPSGDPLGDIYTLDISTMQWTRGQNVTAVNARGGAACGVGKGYLVVWGGSQNNAALNGSLMMTYNLATGNWSTTYNGPDTTAPATPSGTTSGLPGPGSGGSPEGTDSSEKPRLAIIVGAAGGGLVLATAAAGIFLYRFRSRRNKKPEDATTPEPATETSNNPSTDLDREPKNQSTTRLRAPAYISPFANVESEDDVAVAIPAEARRVRGPAAIRAEDWVDLDGSVYTGVTAISSWEDGHQPRQGRLQDGPYGARPMSQHPHAVVIDEMKKGTVQEGNCAAYYMTFPHNPHVIIEDAEMQNRLYQSKNPYSRSVKTPFYTPDEYDTKK